jgi:hypothetical protein
MLPPARAFACMLVALPLAGQRAPIQRPNLSGTWRLNLERSGPILPRGTEALTLVIDHRDSSIHTSETRTVAGKTTHSDGGTARIDGRLRSEHPESGKTVRSMKRWSDSTLIMHWEMTENGITYASDIRTSLSRDGKVLTMAEHYREPGMERVRDWVFEKQYRGR